MVAVAVAVVVLEKKKILGIRISKERNMLVALERFHLDVVEQNGIPYINQRIWYMVSFTSLPVLDIKTPCTFFVYSRMRKVLLKEQFNTTKIGQQRLF